MFCGNSIGNELVCGWQRGTASATNWSVDGSGGADFTGIQDAINNAKEGDTILVYSGVYYENVVVDKSVTVKGIGHPVLDANGSDSAITLTADGITLVGFNATNAGGWDCAGIKVTSNNNIITGNTATNNNHDGIYLYSSSNNSITGNNVCNNNWGIGLVDSSNNTITGNVFVNDGLSVYSSYKNTVGDNTVNGKPLVYLEDVSDYKVEDAGQVILVNCNNITIENLDLSNTSLWKTENSKISNNTVCNNDEGIALSSSSNNNTITGNNVCNNNWGIGLVDSSNNTITGNNVCNNNDEGIGLYDSSNNTITGNNVCNNDDGIRLMYSSNNNSITGNTFVNDGLSVCSSYHNAVGDNTVNGKPLVYLEDASDYKVEDAGQVILVNCDNITVKNLDLSNTSGGIALWKTENSKISNNTVCNNDEGIALFSSSNNTITDNNISNNGCSIYLYSSSNNNTITGNNVSNNNDEGIDLWYSSNNKIYFNNLINNTDNVDSHKSTNIWNSPLEITYTYDGTTYESYLGNSWDDYRGIDAEGDGIGDTHYSIDSEEDGSDDYPLMKPFENYTVTTSHE
jgi:parallel beta-helix repeat protein